jgi:hypothetical protein
MTDTRPCELCGTVFTPRREHARFCSARCRLAWHGENPGDRAAEMSALSWSVAAMCEATGRLARVRAWDRARAAWAVADAVWWVTIVDATLVRYHPEDYDGVLADQAPAERRVTEDTLAGLRFVRNQMGGPPGRCRRPAGWLFRFYRTAVPISPFLVTREASTLSSISSAASGRSGSTR